MCISPRILSPLSRVLLLLLVLVALSSRVARAEAPQAVMPESQYAFFEAYCLNCHDAETEKGKVNLEDLSFDLDTLQRAERWQKVLNAVNSGEMPPENKKQPTPEHKTEFLGLLSKELVTARRILSDSGGVITMRRLNRREYENTMRDLLGVAINADDLPDDETPGSFDTSGKSLFFSSDQFEQYLAIARRALDEAIAAGQKKPETTLVRVESELRANSMHASRARSLEKVMDRIKAYRASDKPATEFGFIDDARVIFEENGYKANAPTNQAYLKRPETKEGALLVTTNAGAYLERITLPDDAAPGRYLLRVRAAHLRGSLSHRRFLEFGTIPENAQSGEILVLSAHAVVGSGPAHAQVIEIPVEITLDGPRTFALRERQPNNRTAARSFLKRARAANRKMGKTGGLDPALWLDWHEVEGPLLDTWPPPSRTALFGTDPKPWKDARGMVERFAKKACRGKAPDPAFIDKIMALYADRIAKGEPFIEAIKQPLSIILASPSFLYLSEPAEDNQRRPLTDRELAVRLSYFLWSAPPDEDLLAHAAAGELHEPEVLQAEIRRLLADPRASEFVSGFTHQWLGMERLDFFQFSPLHYWQFDESLRDASRHEVYETLAHCLAENLPPQTLLKSDFVVINDLLADYYGIDGVAGGHYREVALPEESPRGGLLGMAAIHAMGSDGERSSPVERGVWVLRHLLHDPPPPAPANVPQLNRLSDQILSVRELQQAHQEEAQCAQCHRHIDPIGYGLENFDAAGQWREEETLSQRTGKGAAAKLVRKTFPVDASGTLPDGTPFADYFELRERIAEKEAAFARSFAEGLIAYGLGRPFGFTDEDLAVEILESAQESGGGMADYLEALIQSEPFRTK